MRLHSLHDHLAAPNAPQRLVSRYNIIYLLAFFPLLFGCKCCSVPLPRTRWSRTVWCGRWSLIALCALSTPLVSAGNSFCSQLFGCCLFSAAPFFSSHYTFSCFFSPRIFTSLLLHVHARSVLREQTTRPDTMSENSC